ncbi:hypothetical protein PHLGIDRAFT_17261 [Phlebiopsis gigantea 11061_1 CR5-6]|uniref:Carrier domain-containing protein n=1 Tax=Phlebiopsis gigantea (strain 11061_1 CR5-6) TaxID=745531 RepID=A0A0C3P9J7_PHLG1|nr:hypothetical protein PHLGIDRAFT_17261 [Phlebiopsis gigantea 11061_1 CR5-6]
MSIPLEFVSSLPPPPAGVSLGDQLAEHVTASGRITTFLDCMCSADTPALYSPDTARPPLRHNIIRDFVRAFVLPTSSPATQLGPNDRVMVALPTTPENGLALLALASYHTTAPVNATCTASELFEDAERLRAKAVFTTRDAEDRLELRNLQEKLGCEVIYMADDVNMNMMPLFHVGGIVRNLFAPICSGGSAIMCAGFDAAAFWSLSTDLGSTWQVSPGLSGSPTMHQAILNSKPASLDPRRDTRYRLICNAAGGLLPVLAEELRATFGAVILPSYGSTWPFLVVYMDDLPKNSAGKPLRIKLAQRLGLGVSNDAWRPLDRHWQATAPDKNAPLSAPIPAAKVTFDIKDTEAAIAYASGVREVAVRQQQDGTLEAFVYCTAQDVDAARLKGALQRALDGYAVPEQLYVFDMSLPHKNHLVDFHALEETVRQRTAAHLSPRALVVRDIVADLLARDAALVAGDADFFLLGGNSLLLGRLAYAIRRETGAALKVADLFNHSTIDGIARLVDAEVSRAMALASGHLADGDARSHDAPEWTPGYDDAPAPMRSQTHPLALLVQILPVLFFYPLKAAWGWSTILLFLAFLARYLDHDFWTRVAALLTAICLARFSSRVICPVSAIVVKWVVIGRYKAGTYRMWSNYHLRWWFVNAYIRQAGRGIFAVSPAGIRLYCRLLGAHVGRDVHIDQTAALGEFDLLTFHDGCKVDKALVRGFCVERDGHFRLAPIEVGRNATINTYTQIAPGARIAADSVWGPHASSHEHPSPPAFVKYNRTTFRTPALWLRLLVGLPIIGLVMFVAYVPWLAALYGMISSTSILQPGLNSVESVVFWFATPRRIAFHALARILRVVATPVVQVALGIAVKRLMGLNPEGAMPDATEWQLLRRYVNQTLLSQHTLKHAFDVLGTHYEATSIVFRLMGAKVGKRVYWPGSGIYCPDPELLEIGDDVVFGSRSELFTSDSIGSAKITVGSGAMIADRVVLLPGSRVGRRTVMGSGALGRRGGVYEDGSTWMGNDGGEAAMFSRGLGVEFDEDTITPFGRAYYRREASYFVLPYAALVLVNLLVSAGAAAFWSIPAVVAAQILRQVQIHLAHVHLFAASWYRPATVYGLSATVFVVLLCVQSLLAMAWVIGTKWLVIGRRVEGSCAWDTHSYCQRWQLHLTLSRLLYRGHGNGGVLGPLTGSAYIVWFYRALGATIGKNCAVWAGGRPGLMTEPDLVTLGDRVALDDCSVVAHINSRGRFALNRLGISDGCALRTGSRLLSGAQMEHGSMLLEHALLASGDVAESGAVYAGWPAAPVHESRPSPAATIIAPWDGKDYEKNSEKGSKSTL